MKVEKIGHRTIKDAVDHISEGPPDHQTQAPSEQPAVGAPEPPREGRNRHE